MTIRPATAEDAHALAEVHVASWRAGYRGLVDDEYLAALSVEERAGTWETLLADEDVTVLVAGEPLTGFVAFLAGTGEIRALYVEPDHFRQGFGSALLEAAHERITPGEAVLWVLEGNEPAFAFYARHGYTLDGATALHAPTGREQVRMARKTRR